MNGSEREEVHRTVERVARESYGRLVAYLSVHTHDVAAAEDALSDALVAALMAWPRNGVPQNPEAWLLTTARHSVIDAVRHQRVVSESEPTLQMLKENSVETNFSTQYPDERLKLLFVCAHPAIDPNVHTPLMLQTVLGLDVARIAGAFLISPKTMGQRLVRAKTNRRGGTPSCRGAKYGRPGRFQLEAAIQSVHAERGRSGRIEWTAIARFYGQLDRMSPTIGRSSGYAAALAEANGAEQGLAVLDAIDQDAVSTYQPYWEIRAHILRLLGKGSEAQHAYDRAIGLAEDPAVREFLIQKRG